MKSYALKFLASAACYVVGFSLEYVGESLEKRTLIKNWCYISGAGLAGFALQDFFQLGAAATIGTGLKTTGKALKDNAFDVPPF